MAVSVFKERQYLQRTLLLKFMEQTYQPVFVFYTSAICLGVCAQNTFLLERNLKICATRKIRVAPIACVVN